MINPINTMLALLNKQKTVKSLYIAAKEIEQRYKENEINELEYYAMKQQVEEIFKERLNIDMEFGKFIEIIEFSEEQSKQAQNIHKLRKSGLLTKEQANQQIEKMVIQILHF